MVFSLLDLLFTDNIISQWKSISLFEQLLRNLDDTSMGKEEKSEKEKGKKKERGGEGRISTKHVHLSERKKGYATVKLLNVWKHVGATAKQTISSHY